MAIAKLGRERKIDLIVPNFSALPQAVVGTGRLAIMHRLYAEHLSGIYPIAIHPAPVPLPQIVEIAQWHEIRARDPGLKWLIQLVKARCAALLGDACMAQDA